jgi:hypothetical protein
VWQGGVAGVMVAIAQAFGRLAFHRLVEALDFAVPAWGSRDNSRRVLPRPMVRLRNLPRPDRRPQCPATM